MTHFNCILRIFFAPMLTLLMLFSLPAYSESEYARGIATACAGSSQSVLFQSETTEGGESEGQGEAGGEEGDGEKKEEEEEPDC
ncbi:MAG: hypothetical protein ACR2QW_08365 [bacterium]